MATQLSLEELAHRIGVELRGRAVPVISGVAPLESAGPAEIAFYANPRYRKELAATRAAAVIVAEDDAAHVPEAATPLVAAQPYVAFAKASALFHQALTVPSQHRVSRPRRIGSRSRGPRPPKPPDPFGTTERRRRGGGHPIVSRASSPKWSDG